MKDHINTNELSKTLSGRIIYLVGMMGSGKSKTGPYLAKSLGYRFVDQDDVIEQVAKLSIAEIFQDEGESSFREIETQVLKEIGQRHSLVVATGGGVVTCIENWGILHQGIVIWINPIRERLIERLKADADTRPLLEKENRIASLDKLMKDRHRYYSESDLKISVDQETPEEVAQLILQALKAKLKNSQG